MRETVKRIVTGHERYIAGEMLIYGVCLFDKKWTSVNDDGKIFTSCEHYKSMEHGCGGTVFIFVK